MNNIDAITASTPPRLPHTHTHQLLNQTDCLLLYLFIISSCFLFSLTNQHVSHFLDVKTKLSFLDLWLWEHVLKKNFLLFVYSFFCVCIYAGDLWLTFRFLFFSFRLNAILTPAAAWTFFTAVPLNKGMNWGPPHLSSAAFTSLLLLPVNKRSRCHIWAEKCTHAYVLRRMTVSECLWTEVRGRGLYFLSHPLRSTSLVDWLQQLSL